MAMTAEELQQHCDELYNAIDANKNGILDIDEFRTFCGKVVPTMSREEQDADWAELDANKDTKVTKEELYAFLKKKFESA